MVQRILCAFKGEGHSTQLYTPSSIRIRIRIRISEGHKVGLGFVSIIQRDFVLNMTWG